MDKFEAVARDAAGETWRSSPSAASVCCCTLSDIVCVGSDRENELRREGVKGSCAMCASK